MTDFKAKMHQIRFRLGELTALPRPPTWIWGRFAAGGGAGLGKRREMEGGKWRGGKGGPQVTVEPGPLRALLRHCGTLIFMSVKVSACSMLLLCMRYRRIML